VRSLVSKDKNRFQTDGFDLDLTYITDRIIAMGWPAGEFTVESTWRNSISEVARFLNTFHKDKYQVYNLTEFPYDYSKYLDDKVVYFGFPDHHSPSLNLLLKILESMDSFLNKDPANVVVIHCKAGRGRTGTVISSYLLWNKFFESAGEALEYFADARSSSAEGVGVPSQIRYVYYVQEMLKQNLKTIVSPKTLLLQTILLKPVPSFGFGHTCIPSVEIYDPETNQCIGSSPPCDQLKLFKKEDLCMILIPNCLVTGNVLLRFFHQPTTTLTKPKLLLDFPMFHCAFHTSFIADHHLDLSISELDAPSQGSLRDNRFGPEFSIRITFGAVNQ